MADEQKVTSLEALLGRLRQASQEGGEVRLGTIIDAVGRRSFGPLLLLAGLVTLSPVGDIPGVPTLMAIVVGSIAAQMLSGRETFWLPRWLLERSTSSSRVNKAVEWSQRPAHFVDGLLRPRLTALTNGAGAYLIAATCLLIAVAMPPMELVPFSATGAGAALCAFGLALIAHDGWVAAAALAFTIITFTAVLYNLL